MLWRRNSRNISRAFPATMILETEIHSPGSFHFSKISRIEAKFFAANDQTTVARDVAADDSANSRSKCQAPADFLGKDGLLSQGLPGPYIRRFDASAKNSSDQPATAFARLRIKGNGEKIRTGGEIANELG